MASRQDEQRTAFEALTKGAYLDVLLPKSSDFDAASLVDIGSTEELARAPTRRNLFFDEKTAIILILRTGLSDDDVRKLLPGLEITVIAHATDAVPSSSGHAASVAGKHDMATHKISGEEGVTVVSSGDHTYAIWKSNIHLTRPRARLHRPAVYFSAALGPTVASNKQRHETTSGIMTPYQASPRNVLEPLGHAAEFQGKQIHLAEDRITKVAPRTTKDESARPIRGATKRAFPIMPAIFARVRFSSLPDGVIASLHLETPTVAIGNLEVSAVDVKVLGDHGKTISRSSKEIPSPATTVSCLTDAVLPLRLSAGDEQVLLYQVAAEISASTLAVNIQATVTPEDGSQIELVISSQAKIDAKPMLDNTTYQWSQSEPKAVGEGIALPPRTKSLPSQAKGASAASNQISAHAGDGSVSFLISGPETTSLSRPFSLRIKCINNSTRARSFSFQPVQQKPAVLRTQKNANTRDTNDVTIPLLDRRDKADVFYLTPLVKTGSIRATASYEAALSLTPCVLGLLDLGRLTVVDLDNGQMIEVKDLPDVLCVKANEDNDAPEDVAESPTPQDTEAERKEDEFWDMVHTSWAASEGTALG